MTLNTQGTKEKIVKGDYIELKGFYYTGKIKTTYEEKKQVLE